MRKLTIADVCLLYCTVLVFLSFWSRRIIAHTVLLQSLLLLLTNREE